MRQPPHLPNPGALPAVLIWGVAGFGYHGKIIPCHGHQPQPQPWLIHEWMEEKDPNLPKELCSLSFVLWVSFSLLSYYPVLRETYSTSAQSSCLPPLLPAIVAFCLFAAVPVRFEVSVAGRLGFFESKSSLAALIGPEPRAPGFSACHTKSLKLPKSLGG